MNRLIGAYREGMREAARPACVVQIEDTGVTAGGQQVDPPRTNYVLVPGSRADADAYGAKACAKGAKEAYAYAVKFRKSRRTFTNTASETIDPVKPWTYRILGTGTTTASGPITMTRDQAVEMVKA